MASQCLWRYSGRSRASPAGVMITLSPSNMALNRERVLCANRLQQKLGKKDIPMSPDQLKTKAKQLFPRLSSAKIGRIVITANLILEGAGRTHLGDIGEKIGASTPQTINKYIDWAIRLLDA